MILPWKPPPAAFRWGVAVAVALCGTTGIGTAQPWQEAEALIAELGCAGCHAGLESSPLIEERAPALDDGQRYPPDYLSAYLRRPIAVRRHIGRSRMPDFGLSEAEALALTLFLTQTTAEGPVAPGGNADANIDADPSSIAASRSEYSEVMAARSPGVSAEQGRRLFQALNCAACHAHDQFSGELNGPDLAVEGSRVNRAWLGAYLLQPHPLRPFGYFPGSGARMPNFRLSAAEAALIGDYLMSRAGAFDSPGQAFRPKPLSAFARRKARLLLETKLSCLGCHSLGGEGGRIGPALDNAGERLQPDYVYQIINRPDSLGADIMMPGARLPEKTLNLIVNYLLEQTEPSTMSAYPSLIQHPPHDAALAEGGALLYDKYCAQCHGVEGHGDGFNAPYLPDPPTRHSDAAHMSTRPDDTLYDGVAVGGYVLDKSHRMPAWGAKLSATQIRELVAHMRRLCQCQAPDWSLR